MPAKKAAKKVSKKASTKKAAKTAVKKTAKKAAKKKSSKKAADTAPAKAAAPAAKTVPVKPAFKLTSQEEIRYAAYLNSCGRIAAGHAPDAIADWLAAERALQGQ